MQERLPVGAGADPILFGNMRGEGLFGRVYLFVSLVERSKEAKESEYIM